MRARDAAAMTSGISSTTTGVSLMKPLTAAAETITPSGASHGAAATHAASRRAIGSSAPVMTSAWPSTIKAQIATSAGWPKPEKKRIGSTAVPLFSVSGHSAKPSGSRPRMARLTVAIGSRSWISTANTSTANTSMARP